MNRNLQPDQFDPEATESCPHCKSEDVGSADPYDELQIGPDVQKCGNCGMHYDRYSRAEVDPPWRR